MAVIRRRIILLAVTLAILLAALGTRLAKSFTKPLTEIVEGTQRIALGAPSTNLQPRDSELATLVEAIDQMAERIARGRRQLVREKQLVEKMIENVAAGVVSVDREGRVLLLNRHARELMSLEVGDPLRSTLAASPRLRPLVDFLESSSSQPAQATLAIRHKATPGDTSPDARDGDLEEWTAIWVPLPGRGEPTALLVLEDVTEVLRGQRLEAWAEMARMIAHEIKNPLTPIRLSAEHLREVYANRKHELDEIFEQCTANILEQVDELQQISSEFSTYSRIPRAELRLGDLGEAVARIVESYRSSPGGVAIRWEPPADRLEANFDERLLGRALRNLLENALRAVGDDGAIDVRLGRDNGVIELKIADTGPGVQPAHLARIFEPYFSTADSGTGLGLPIARKIVEEHGGSIRARNRSPHGLELTIALPVEGERTSGG